MEAVEIVAAVVLALVGVIFTFVSRAAIKTGEITNQRLSTLDETLHDLVTRLSVLERVVDALPPSEWQTKIELMEARLMALENHCKNGVPL